MDIEGLRKSPIGRLVPISGHDARWGSFDYWAFVPAPLPDRVPLVEKTFGCVADAAMAIGRLDVAADKIPNPMLLARPTLRKEAVSTSALEGTYAPLMEVLEGEIVGHEGVRAEAREVINYVRAAELSLQRLKSRPVSVNLIAELQQVLVRGTRGDGYDAGRIRDRIVFVGPERGPIDDARFIPPPPGDVLQQGVSDWERWIHQQGDTHLLVRVALGHYQFEALHPFSDGNGRLGRLLMVLQLIEEGALRYPLLNLAEWLEPRKDAYQANLLQLSKDGDFDHWVTFVCTGVREQAEAGIARIDRLLAIRESIVERVKASGSRGNTAVGVADELIGYPVMDIPSVARQRGVAYQSAKEAIERLVSLGVVREVRRSGRTRRLFICDDVLDELDR